MSLRVWQITLSLALLGLIALVFFDARENIKYCKEHCQESPECRQLSLYVRNACVQLEAGRIQRLMIHRD